MAAIPNALDKVKLLYDSKSKPDQLASIGRELVRLERYSEAIDFLRAAKADADLQGILQKAIAMGDLFLLKAAARALRRTPTDDEMLRTRQAATTKGKLLYAQEPAQQPATGDAKKETG